MKYYLFMLFSMIFIWSCGGKSSQEQNPNTTIDEDSFRIYSLDLTAKKKPLKELVESIELIQLEETSRSLLSFVRSLKWIDNQFYLLGLYDIFVFDENGRFKERFNRQGEGPEEHGHISGFWVDNDELYLYRASRVYHYDARRNHVATHQLGFHNLTLTPYRDGYVGNTEGVWVQNDTTAYRITKYNSDFESTDFLVPFSSKRANYRYDFVKSFEEYKDGLTFIPSKNDTMFWYKNGEVQALMKFDFASGFYWNEDWQSKDFRQLSKALRDENNQKVINIQHALQDEWVHLNLLIGNSIYIRMLLNRTTGQYFCLALPTQLDSWQFRDFYQKHVGLVTLPSDQVYDLISGLDESQYSFREGTSLEDIESSENPVIAWVKFKMP